MNSPSATSGVAAQLQAAQLRAPTRRLHSDHANSLPQSVSQDYLPYSADDAQQRHPGRAWDADRGTHSGASSPPFTLDSAASSAPSMQLRGGSPSVSHEGPLLPPRGRETTSPGQRSGTSPLNTVTWAAQGASARIEAQQRDNLSKMYHALAETTGRVDELDRGRRRDDERYRELKNQVEFLGKHAQQTATLRQELQVKDLQIQALIAQAFERIDGVQNKIKNLTELCVENTDDKFEAQGPLPKHYRRIQTANGPYALHDDVYRRLIPYLDFHGPKAGPDARNGRTHVELSRQMLSHMALWVNGLSLAPELIGFAALRDLCTYARQHDIQDLLKVTLNELHEAGMAAMAPLVSKHARPSAVQGMADAMVGKMCELLIRPDLQQEGPEVLLQVPVPRPPHGMVRSGPLFVGDERTSEWHKDLFFAFRVFVQYCAVFRVNCRKSPVIEAREGDRHILVNIPLELTL